MADTVDLREIHIFRGNSENINRNHSVNLVIRQVACSYHSNKHKINCLLPRNTYTSLSYSAMIFRHDRKKIKHTSCISELTPLAAFPQTKGRFLRWEFHVECSRMSHYWLGDKASGAVISDSPTNLTQGECSTNATETARIWGRITFPSISTRTTHRDYFMQQS